jgi:hypothetical protein
MKRQITLTPKVILIIMAISAIIGILLALLFPIEIHRMM